MIFIADFIACSTYFGQYYAHHPHHTDNLKTKAPNTTGSDHLYNSLELLMMGIVLPEICWAGNKICNKYHLLHLVGILFPHNNDDARSKSLQRLYLFFNSTTIQIHPGFCDFYHLWIHDGTHRFIVFNYFRLWIVWGDRITSNIRKWSSLSCVSDTEIHSSSFFFFL